MESEDIRMNFDSEGLESNEDNDSNQNYNISIDEDDYNIEENEELSNNYNDNNINHLSSINNINLMLYNTNEFTKDNVIEFLMDHDILKRQVLCDKCHNVMNINKNKNNKDGIIWRCKKSGINKHDEKKNIRNKSIFENTKIDIRILYFILFYNYIEKYIINQTYINCKEFTNQLNIETISRKAISKIFNTIRIKIMKKTHDIWNHNLMGLEPCSDGISKIEIDESKIVTYDGHVRWMFGIADRGNYDIRIYYVNDNRCKETLLPLIKKKCIHFSQYYNS